MTISSFAFEEDVAASIGISAPQLRFTVCLFACLPICWLQSIIRHVYGAHIFAIVSGFLMIYLPFGSGVLHALPPMLFTYVAMHLWPSKCGILTWLTCFPHLIYLHIANASGAAWQEGAMDATGAFMILFLKLAAVAQCRQDAQCLQNSAKQLTPYQKEKMLERTPSFLEFFSYIFCFGHLLSGPFTEFADYKNYIERKDIWSKKLPSRLVPFLKSLFMAVLCMAVFVALGGYYPYTVFFSDGFESANLGEKYLLSYAIGTLYRFKYYFAWGLAEAASLASGYAYRGTVVENGVPVEKWDRCKNVNILQTEFANSFAKIPAHWNICTGTFLRRYVYERITPAGSKPTFFTLLITQLVSAVWHGLYPGYILFFVSATVAIAASKVMHRWEQSNSLAKTPVYRISKVIFASLTLNYTASAFMILTLKESIMVYASMRFIPHLICLAIAVVGPILTKSAKSKMT